MKKDLIVAAICILGSMALYLALGTIDSERARTFPRVIIILMAVLSAFLLIQDLTLSRRKGQKAEGLAWSRFLPVFVMIVAYIALMERIGFYLSAFLFFVAVIVVLGRSSLTPARMAMGLGVSAAFVAVVFVLFSVFLEVQTPRGILF